MKDNKETHSLWTWDFTVITLGSVVSMLGGMLSGFALSLMVLEYTGSTFLYVIYNVCYQIPSLVCPLLAGPYLDRMSRKKVIYWLDFLSAGIYLLIFVLLRRGWFSYPVMLVLCIVIGIIGSVYSVAWESFYPNLIREGNHSRAYSVSSLMMDLTGLAYPLGAVLYEVLGAAPLFAVAAATFFIAACFETTVRCRETHMDSAPPADGLGTLRRFRRDFREGLDYIRREKGLLVITLYFMASGFVGSGCGNLYLPFFQNNGHLFSAWPIAAVTLYTVVSNFEPVGRLVGGGLHYKFKLPPKKKFAIALCVYAAVNLFEGVVLWLPVPLMAAAFFLNGLLSVTSYNIRIAATQTYIPDTHRGRFNGTFQMLCAVGSIAGALAGGGLAEWMPERWVMVLLSAVGVFSVWLFMYRGRRHVAAIYNRDV